ncbi:uncharacterized protein LOC134234752 [Saccostrea cucullata]|uniref:uncharacterized protein LOC134234752 n=1 Tax=Saccostrea cuccullata TaxID=36930 RepID=UPI002ED38982
MRVVPLQARTNIFLEKGIYVDENSRSCKSHFLNDILTQTAMSQIEGTNDETYLNRTDVADLLQRMRQSMLLKARLDFENPLSLSDEDYYYFTGLSKNQFFEVLSSLTSLRNTSVRSKRTCLAILLVKLRTGLSNNLLAVLFSLKKSQIQRSIHAAKNALIQDYVPKNLGFQHIDHDTFAQQHTIPLAKTLFTSGTSNSAVLIMDGTYLYIQKSSDYHFQRVSYSLYKYRPLVKMMVIAGSDGYILSVLGPYRQIPKTVIQASQNMHSKQMPKISLIGSLLTMYV